MEVLVLMKMDDGWRMEVVEREDQRIVGDQNAFPTKR